MRTAVTSVRLSSSRHLHKAVGLHTSSTPPSASSFTPDHHLPPFRINLSLAQLRSIGQPPGASACSVVAAMASAVCASSSVASIAAPSTSKVVSNVGSVKNAFLSGRALRMTKIAASVKGDTTVSAVAAPPPSPPTSERPLWFPGSTAPEWLDGSLPGDFGFDPLGLSSDPDLLKWFVQAELVNGRWAMLGAAGIFIPEFLTKQGILNTPSWTVAGEKEYFADSPTLLAIELILFAWVEGRRWADILNPGSVNVDPVFPNYKLTGTDVGYPGGLWFDPLGWGKSDNPEKLKELRTKEVKNGRLAMLAFLGAVVQANYTHTGPMENLYAHLADPGHNNIFALTNFIGK